MNYQAPTRQNRTNNQSRTVPGSNRRPAAVRGTSVRRVGTGNSVAKNPTQRQNTSNRSVVRKTAVHNESAISMMKAFIKPMLAVEQDRVRTVKAKTRKPFPLGAVVMVTICTLLLMFLVISYVQINEYTIEVASLRGELADLVDERKELTLALEEKNDMVAIEAYATENLGMVKSDQLTKKHISLEQEDKIEVVETEPSQDVTVVTGVMSAIADNFTGLWEYIG